MSFWSRASGFLRAMVIVLTIVLSAGLLMLFHDNGGEKIDLEVGDPAPQQFIATQHVEVLDQEATQAARNEAYDSVAPVYVTDSEAAEEVSAAIEGFFSEVNAGAEPYEDGAEDPGDLIPDISTSSTVAETTIESETTSSTEEVTTTTGEEAATTTSSTTTTVPLAYPPRELQIAMLVDEYPSLDNETIVVMVDIRNDDFERVQDGEEALFGFVETEALEEAEAYLEEGVRASELDELREGLLADPPSLILLRDLEDEQRAAVEAAVADLLAHTLQANEILDEAATELARQAAAAAVEDITVSFGSGVSIVDEAGPVSAVQLAAIEELGLLEPESGEGSPWALAIIAAVVIGLAFFYVWRTGKGYWQQPKMMVLLGLLIVLAAAIALLPGLVDGERPAFGFLLPAAFIGFLAAGLFSARVALAIVLPMAAFTAVGGAENLGLVVFAIGATVAPIPLVSVASSRAQLNLAVAVSALILAPLAAASSWFFYAEIPVWHSTGYAFGTGFGSGLLALGLMPLLAAAFGVTTTQTLLDLTDRNHPALRLIEEEAPGTFNHSIMVGSLAGRTARAVGGNALLAQAMAYYHDLGKTVSPQYFVENQFGVSNPHDRLPPEQSAAIVRSHVVEGLRLAREYHIPSEVSQGILSHHGTSLMRYFYHKATELYGEENVDPADYRHRGRKPRTKEAVIVMMSDACEAAVRALVQEEDPTEEGLRRTVERVIAEKVEDGQLEDSEVTFGELTRIKEAIVDSLISHYHARIPYPGFPG
jgi:putative nucleotidyltransferase with HDIG domain